MQLNAAGIIRELLNENGLIMTGIVLPKMQLQMLIQLPKLRLTHLDPNWLTQIVELRFSENHF